MAKANNWTTAAESKFPWERDALDFVRAKFPSHEPYRAWANFEFIADDGSINEVDLLVFTPQGFFLIEIKSRPGRLFGDAGTWTWETDDKLSAVDNPLIATILKAKKLRSLLQRQKAFKKKGQPPFVEALVFCSAPDLRCELQGNARFRVCLRDRDAVGESPAHPGIMAAIMRRECPGLDLRAKGTHDRPMVKIIGQAMDQAGIRPSQRMRKVSDYVLEQLIGEGPGYQDWQATHTQVTESKRRVRLYLVRAEATEEDRTTIQRAALREFQILETLEHPGILRAYTITEHELGPALLFEHDPLSVRLDHYLAQQKDKLSVEVQLDLIRQIAEVVRYAHDKKVIHRGLCPQSILVTNLNSDRPRIKVFNWQIGYRQGTTSTGVSRAVSATSHVDRLVEDSATAYMAPEALTEANTGEHLDVFSLGAIAYHIFSGLSPAANAVELSEKLRETKGLQISSVLNGASEWLQELVRYATHPVVPDRMGSVADFLGILDEVENELTTPEHDYIDDPSRAQIGDLLPGGYSVVRRLGQGACSVALLVERDGQDFVLKVANDPENNARVKDEADLLTTGSESLSRAGTDPARPAGEVTPEEADARQFEERLQRSIKEGSFLALLVNPKYYDRARSELCRRFPLQLVDFEGVFLDALHETADNAKVKWDLVLQTDTKPHEGDWDKLMMLVGRAMPQVELSVVRGQLSVQSARHSAVSGQQDNERSILLVYPGLLARYDEMKFLETLREEVTRGRRLKSCWILLPGDNQAMIDGKPVPLIGPGQKTRIPESWLANLHRGNGIHHGGTENSYADV